MTWVPIAFGTQTWAKLSEASNLLEVVQGVPLTVENSSEEVFVWCVEVQRLHIGIYSLCSTGFLDLLVYLAED